jgi:flagellar FliL protein
MKKLLLFVLLPLLLLIGAGAGAFVAGLIPGFGEPPPPPTAEELAEMERIANTAPSPAQPSPPGALFHTLDEFVVNLRSNRGYPVFVLLSVTVEVPDQGAVQSVAAQEARIRDGMIVFLSSLTPQDLNGYEGITRVRNFAWKLLRDLVGTDLILNIQISKLTVK